MTRRAPFDLYIASCETDGGILCYRIENDKAKRLWRYPLDRPMYMISDGNEMHVILREGFEKCSAYLSLAVRENGTLSEKTAPVSTFGEVACHLMADEGGVFVANYVSGSVAKIGAGLVTHAGRGAHPTRQERAHTHFVSRTPDGKYIAAVDLGVDKIFLYTDELSPVSEIKLPDGLGPRHFACHESGKFIFVANELDSSVSLLSYSDGKLTLIEAVSTRERGRVSENTLSAIRVRGDEIFVANRGDDTVAVLRFADGRLFLSHSVPTYGKEPRDFILHDGLIISANQNSNEVAIISEEGELLLSIPIKQPMCLIATER